MHAAAEALEAIGITDQPLASIAKREEIIYVYGQEDEPVVLDRFSPILHLVQSIRDEAHRFAVTFHRTRRNARQLTSELDAIPGVGEEDRAQTAEGIRQLGAGARRQRRSTGRRGGPGGRAQGSDPLSGSLSLLVNHYPETGRRRRRDGLRWRVGRALPGEHGIGDNLDIDDVYHAVSIQVVPGRFAP